MAENGESQSPRLFISYSWSSRDHEEWVVDLAEELVSQGIDVVLDKWDLQPGHDANAFMETMVTDPLVTKVLLICDEAYARKSDGRTGGAGTEAQIITPKIYEQTKQDKFVAVVRERDAEGKPYLPAYYSSRIFFDLHEPASYAAEFDKIVRWAWGQPLHVRPERGARPAFLEERQSGRIASAVPFRRAAELLRSGSDRASSAMAEYLQTISRGLEEFRIVGDRENRNELDDGVISSIAEFKPYRDQLIHIFELAVMFSKTEDVPRALHRFFEHCIPYLHAPEGVSSWADWDFDNFRFIVHELFLYCLGSALRHERYESAAHLINNEYYWRGRHGSENVMHDYSVFRAHLASLEQRNTRLNLRRMSLHADLLKERNRDTGLDFQYLMMADFVLYLRSAVAGHWGWWPQTLLYADKYGGAFEMFARAKSSGYFERIRPVLGGVTKDEFVRLVTEIPDQFLPRWQFDRLPATRLAGIELLGTRP